MKDKLKQILEKLDPKMEILTESVHKELIQMVDDKEKIIKEEAYAKALEVTNKKLEEQDEEYTKKVKLLIEKIDNSYTKSLKKLVEDIDTDHTKKLLKVKKFFEEQNITEQMVESVSSFLDTYLAEVTPKEEIIDQAKLKRLEKIVLNIKESIMLTDDEVQKEFKEAILDAKTQLDTKDKTIDSLMLEKVELKQKINKIEVGQLLESKTKNMSPKLKAYFETLFKDADKITIEEKFEEAKKAFESEEAKRRDKLIAEADSKKQVKNPVIKEEKEIVTKDIDPEVAKYIPVTQKSLNSKWRINK